MDRCGASSNEGAHVNFKTGSAWHHEIGARVCVQSGILFTSDVHDVDRQQSEPVSDSNLTGKQVH